MLSRVRSLLQAESGTELVRFALVGVSGVLVNNALLYALHGVLGWPLVFASALAVEGAIVNNFIWNDRWTFVHREKTSLRFLRFNAVSLGGLLINTLTLVMIVALADIHYLVANLIAIGTAMAWNFAANARWTWRPSDRQESVDLNQVMKGEVMTDDLVVVPTYNEARNIEDLVHRILSAGPFGVLIVDDASPDGTGIIADRLSREEPARVAVLHRRSKAGLGAAYRAGFRTALQTGAGRIYQMDGDLSHEPEALVGMREALLRDSADLVIGSRYVPGGRVVGWPIWRKILSRGGSVYAGVILDLGVRDLTGGFKGWSRDVLDAVRLDETQTNGYAFQIETTYRAVLAGARVEELPIEFADRQRGVSKMGLPIVLEAIRVVPGFRLKRPRVGSVREAVTTGR
jgi:dolichol-phosphate mannosyltransferase